MPSHAPLSNRDGRIRSSSVQQVGESLYYSNDDIELLHQVVTLGQEILPTLPKRDKLPTTALFRAADIVFPRHGLDPDGEDKLSRIIFMVGGMRSTDNLIDRFRTVLSRMGIELEYIEESSVDGDNNGLEPPSPARIKRRRRSSSRRSSSQHRRNIKQQPHQPLTFASPPSPSTHSTAASSLHERPTGAVAHPPAHSSHGMKGRRRRNSDTAAELVVGGDANQQDRGRNAKQMYQGSYQKIRSISRNHQRRRSDSQAPSQLNHRDHIGQISEPRESLPVQKQPSHPTRPITPWLSQIPQYTTDAEKTEGEQQQPDRPDDDDLLDEADEQDEAHDKDQDYANEADEEDFDDENENEKDPSVDEYTRSLQLLLPIRQRKQEQQQQQQQQQHQHQYHNHHLNAIPSDIQGAPKANFLLHTHNYQHHHDLPLRTRLPASSLPRPVASQHVIDAPIHTVNSSVQAAGSFTAPQSPRTMASDNEEFYIPSDTTMQEELEKGPAPKVNPLIMAKVADTYFMRFTFLGGLAVEAWRTIAEAYREQEHHAAQIDRELSTSEAVLVWKDVAKAHIDNMTGKMKEVQQSRDERSVTVHEVPEPLPHDTADAMADNGAVIVAAAAAAAAADIATDAAPAGGDVEAPDMHSDEGVEAPDMHDAESDKESVAVDEDADVDEDDDEGAEEFRLRQEQRDRLMKRAARVYTITTLFNAVSHWQAMAHEEISRTRVARRHIVRKKVFFAWRDQTASDHAKAATLTLGWFVQRWTAALRQVQHEGQFAVQFYGRDLATMKFWTWFRAHQAHTATAWAQGRIKRQAVNTWLDALAAASRAKKDADDVARHIRLSAAGNQWIDRAQTQESILLRIEEQENETYMRAALQDWAKESFCHTQLRVVQSASDKRDKARAFNTWRQSAADSQHRAAQLDLDITEEYAAHWQRETRLALFQADNEFGLKADAVHSWVLAEKLAFLVRYRDEQLLHKTCLALKASFGTDDRGHSEQEREDELARLADEVYKRSIVIKLWTALDAQVQDNNAMHQMADEYDTMSVVCSYVHERWYPAAAQCVQKEEVARRGAFYVGVVNAVDGWAAHARAVREQRLRATYRSFRRQAKRQTAAACVAAWTSVLDDVGDEATANDGTGRGGGYDVADELRYEHETHTIFATLNSWILATNDRLYEQSVAAEADTEVYLSRWRLQLAGCEELGAAAAEHDTVTQMAGRWGDWELQAVQARARAHTATALHEKNDRRLGRRVLAVWQQQLAGPGPETEAVDFQASYGPLSSVARWPADGGGRTSTSQWRLDALASSPLVARSDHLPRGARAASSLLHPIIESPMPSAPVQRPLFARGSSTGGGIAGSYSVPVPGNSASASVPAVPALYGPSPAAGPLRRLHRSTATAPAYGKNYQKHEPGQLPPPQPPQQQQQQPQPQHSDSPFRTSTVPSSSLATSATLTPGRDPQRHLQLQRRLQSAARLADSVQLGPMSEFDDYDYDDMDATQIRDVDVHDSTTAAGHDADVSSEGEGDRRGRQHTQTQTARHQHQLLTLGQSTKTPTRFVRSDELPMVSSARAPALPRRQAGFSLRKAAAAAAAAAASHPGSGPAPRPTGPALAFDPVTTTPMGPLPSPFERRLRAAYGGSQDKPAYYDEEDDEEEEDEDEDDDENDDDGFQDDPRRSRRLAPVTATPLRPLRMSTLSMPASAAPRLGTVGRPGARVTFADSGR